MEEKDLKTLGIKITIKKIYLTMTKMIILMMIKERIIMMMMIK